MFEIWVLLKRNCYQSHLNLTTKLFFTMERASSLLWGGMKLRIMTNINNSLTQFDPSIYHDHLRLVNSQIITFTTTIQFYRTFEVCFYWWYIFNLSNILMYQIQILFISDRNMTVIAVMSSQESEENEPHPGPRLVFRLDVTRFSWTLDLSYLVLNTSWHQGAFWKSDLSRQMSCYTRLSVDRNVAQKIL